MTTPTDPGLAGRVVLVTGGAGGIGGAAARALSSAGALVAAADLAGPGLDRLHAESGCETVPLDVADPGAPGRVVDAVVARRGRLDVVVNAAGIASRETALETTTERWDRVLAVNLRGTFLVCQAAARAMGRAGSGSIVNVASELALVGEAGHAAYIASKAGVAGLTRALAVEWAPLGIRVNAVAPGLTLTSMTADVDESDRERYRERAPNRRLGRPEDIAGPILFLASDASRHVVGQVLVADGGFTIA